MGNSRVVQTFGMVSLINKNMKPSWGFTGTRCAESTFYFFMLVNCRNLLIYREVLTGNERAVSRPAARQPNARKVHNLLAWKKK
jgi:hypothetical protein